MDAAIVPECYGDTCLAETLVPPKRKYNHQKGCPNVAKLMQRVDSFMVGIIDKDKREIDYAKNFVEITELTGSLKLLKHPTKHHYLIYLCPAFEMWVINSAQEVGVNLSDFGVPNDLDELRSYAKRQMDKGDVEYQALRRLFRELQSRQAPSVLKLANWILYLKNNNYSVDVEVLKKL